jgi:hypothetical protein
MAAHSPHRRMDAHTSLCLSSHHFCPRHQRTLLTRFDTPPFSQGKVALSLICARNNITESDQRGACQRAHAKLSEFWGETLAVVARVRLYMANTIFPYLQRYRRKDLTDPGANVVLAAQAQRDFFSFHVRLTRRTMVWPPCRSHGLDLNQVFPVELFELGQLLHWRRDYLHIVFHHLTRKIPENRRLV